MPERLPSDAGLMMLLICAMSAVVMPVARQRLMRAAFMR